jgi:hypothetical protein
MSHQDLLILLKLFCVILGAFGLIVLDIMHQDNTKYAAKRAWKLRDRLFFAMNQNKEAAT